MNTRKVVPRSQAKPGDVWICNGAHGESHTELVASNKGGKVTLLGSNNHPRPSDQQINYDTYSRTEQAMAADGVHRLPSTLGAAVAAFRRDEFLAETLGAEVHDAYATYKEAEWTEYNTVVGDWEVKRYLELW